MRLGQFLLFTTLAVLACCSTSANAEGFVQINNLPTNFRHELTHESRRNLKESVREANAVDVSPSSGLVEKVKEIINNLKAKGGDMRLADISSSAKKMFKELSAALKTKIRNLHQYLKNRLRPKYQPMSSEGSLPPRTPSINPLNGEVKSTTSVHHPYSQQLTPNNAFPQRLPNSPNKPNEVSTTAALSRPHDNPQAAQNSLKISEDLSGRSGRGGSMLRLPDSPRTPGELASRSNGGASLPGLPESPSTPGGLASRSNGGAPLPGLRESPSTPGELASRSNGGASLPGLPESPSTPGELASRSNGGAPLPGLPKLDGQ